MSFNLAVTMKVKPSYWFAGILAEMNGVFTGWSDGSYDWGAQHKDFLHTPTKLPSLEDDVFKTPLSKRLLEELLEVYLCLISSDFKAISAYLSCVKFIFVVGYPRSGGSYLTKEIFRSIGINHARVSEALAHDGYPDMSENWFLSQRKQPYFYLQDSILQIAEFLVLSKNYYIERGRLSGAGQIIIPKKMHKLVNWASSLKSLLVPGGADYVVTVRNPLPVAISIYEKSGGMPTDGKFPFSAPRSAIEGWICADLLASGYTETTATQLNYFEAVRISWTRFYLKMASSGLFSNNAHAVTMLPYDPVTYQEFLHRRYADVQNPNEPEPLLVHDKYREFPQWSDRADAAIASMKSLWCDLGLRFPTLTPL